MKIGLSLQGDWWGRIEWATWVLFLVTLPVTSFPFFPSIMGGSALVRPLSIYPLALLLVISVLPRLLKLHLPRSVNALLAFVCVALVSSVLSLLRGIDPLLGVTVEDRVLRNLLTLGIGIGIYLTVSMLPRSEAALRHSLRWLYAGFSFALLWGSLQAGYVITGSTSWFGLMSTLQDYVSTRRLFGNRVSGMTYEPNWFAEQLTFLLLPFLLSAVLTNTTVFHWRWKRVTVEVLLTIWTIALLPFTFSRAGVLNLGVMVALAVLFLRPRPAKKAGVPVPRARLIATRLLQAVLVLAIIAGLIYAAGTRNEFFARIWDYWEKKNTSLTGYFEYLGFGARFTYAETAFRVYENHPWIGVGLGNYAFFFEEMLADRPLAEIPEVLRQVTPDIGRSQLVTSKNIYTRLLAETGIIGTAVFLAFVLTILGGALYLWFSRHPGEKYWGTAGILGMAVFFLAAFSFDSFALPNMWVVFGLITAANRIFSPEEAAQLSTSAEIKPANFG